MSFLDGVRWGYALARSNYGPGADVVDQVRAEAARLRAELADVTRQRNALEDELDTRWRAAHERHPATPVLRAPGHYADLDVQATRAGVLR